MLIMTQDRGEIVNLDRFDRVYCEELGTQFEKGLKKANFDVRALRYDTTESFDSSSTSSAEIVLGSYDTAERARSELEIIAIAAENGKAVYYMSEND